MFIRDIVTPGDKKFKKRCVESKEKIVELNRDLS
jgi:hypothetical protein